jgi:hypothetical protein
MAPIELKDAAITSFDDARLARLVEGARLKP